MSEKEPRPRRKNANTHPARILLNQKRRTTTEKAAIDKEKADRKADAASKTQMDRNAAVTEIAQFEDALQKEDKAYGKSTSGKGASYREADQAEDDTLALDIVTSQR
jgi:hypothetical protein